MHLSFQSRALHFYGELRGNRYPNAVTLAGATRCSRNTAMRCIERLRDEYGMPLDYDSSERGYFLKDPTFELTTIAPGKDEFTALLLLRDLASIIDSRELHEAVESLWQQCALKNKVLSRDLRALMDVFSSDLTQVGDLADTPVLTLVDAAHRGESVSISYKSPWRHSKEQLYRGRILRVHFSDGSLYVYLHEETGRGLVLNASFIRSFDIVADGVPLAPLAEDEPLGSWLEGFGVWASEDLVPVEIEINPPAAEYYGAQRWHEDQVDEVSADGVLIRKFPSMISPELVRRVLSIGKYVRAVRPDELSKLVASQAKEVLGNLS